MKISIFGLGYVGAVCAGCLASEQHTVVGVDINSLKVDSMNSGVAPIIEPKLTELFTEGYQTKKLSATTSN